MCLNWCSDIEVTAMILIVGDSNLRNVVEENQHEIQSKLQEDIVFEQAGTNESLKAILEAVEKDYSKIVVGTLLNEVAKLARIVKTRDEVINNIAKDQSDIIAKHADLYPGTKYIVLPPFMRFEPAWIPDKLRIIQLQLKDHIERASKPNIMVVAPVDITDQDVNSDNVHLNAVGKAKLLASLIGAPTPMTSACQSPMTNWANTPNTRSKTKRVRVPQDSDEEDMSSSKKNKPNDFAEAILTKLNQMTEEMREERTRAAERAESLVIKLDSTSAATSDNAKKIEKLSTRFT